MWKNYRENKRDKKSASICWFTLHMDTMTAAEPIQKEDPGASSGFPT